MRTVKEYVESVKSSAGPGPGTQSGTDKLVINKDPEGYPIAPRPSTWEKITKDDIEKLYRMYITIHYRRFICRIRRC